MPDAPDPFYRPGYIPPARKPRPTEAVWTLRRGDHTVTCELLSHGEYGWEVQTLKDGEFFSGRRFDTHAQALQWADLEREAWTERT